MVNAPTWTTATWKYGYPYVRLAQLLQSWQPASVTGTIVGPGTSAVTASGICYATTATPTTPCSTDGALTAATYTSTLTGLTPNGVTYYT
ncbi:MAG: hypothetical protein R3E08_00800 [Thiotrichaceae bacterium]